MKRTWLFGAGAAMALLWACAASAQAPGKGPRYLFADDAAIAQPQQQLEAGITRQRLIESDAWLNAPLTRLDYILMRMEAALASEAIPLITTDMAEHFGEQRPRIPAEVSVAARYVQAKGRIYVTATLIAQAKTALACSSEIVLT